MKIKIISSLQKLTTKNQATTGARDTAAETVTKVKKVSQHNGRNINVQLKPKKSKTAISNRKLFIGASVFAVILIVVAITIHFIFIPAYNLNNAVNKISAEVEILNGEVAAKDLRQINKHISVITNEIDNVNREIDKFEFLKTLGFTRGYYDNLQIIKEITQKSEKILVQVLPELENILSASGYKVVGQSDAEQNAITKEDNISTLLAQAPKLLTLYEQSEPEIIDLIATVNKLDPQYIPDLGNRNIPQRLRETQQLLNNFPEVSTELKLSFRVLPQLLGIGKPAEYMMIFQNEKEMRPTGGLITAYGHLTVKNGELSNEITAQDTWKLNKDLLNYGIFPRIYNKNGQLFLMTYNGRCGGASTRPQDSGVYPDQHQAIDAFRAYYDAAAGHRILKKEYPAYDHVVMVNTAFAESIISLVEPVDVVEAKQTITSATMARTLTDYFNTEAAFGKVETAARKDFIKQLATAVKNKISDLSISDFPNVFRVVLKNFLARNITIYSKNSDLQTYLDQKAMSGRIPTAQAYSGDYFMHSEGQYCGLKANFYVKNKVTINVDISKDNSITKTVNVEWSNEAYNDEVPFYIIDQSGRFPYAVWSRLIVPNGSKFIASDSYKQSGYFGYSPKQYYSNELQGYVLDHVVLFRHQRKRGEAVKTKSYFSQYRLPANLNYSADKGYETLILKHAGKANEAYTINIFQGGQTYTSQFVLDQDKIITWKQGQFTVENYETKLDSFIDSANQVEQFIKTNLD